MYTRTQKIKAEMARHGHNQQQLATLLNIHIASLNRKLKGKSDFKANEILKLAEIYNKPSDYFL